MDLNLSVFQEPRGVMRIFHVVFSICAFSTITGYSTQIIFNCLSERSLYELSYPFDFLFERKFGNCTLDVTGNFSSDAKFFVTTGVLAMLYSIVIILVYIKFDEAYKRNPKIPMLDFLITVFFGVLWLSSSAAWANGLVGLKAATNRPGETKGPCQTCSVTTSNFSTLNISVIFGFLNFFLWAADLWFVYKETQWFQAAQPQPNEGM
ncbi:unnamed protein product [Acanthoscelides obtectus]|uniref:MARVEL domain-containing protein n=1 Tax=Acanthoscelides obtectus TaxID=200917 RepID=A0A9P0NZC5_ACAOB|nr:unnamed protein product [Acanthoscelides obtectus]CAK1629052.1 Synaptoporin [Acanthoscelides obtectus]